MTILEKEVNGVTTKIDLTPIEEITENFERILRRRKNWEDRSHVDYSTEILLKMKDLDKDQLEFLANNFMGLIIKYNDLYQKVLDNPEKECESIMRYKELFKF